MKFILARNFDQYQEYLREYNLSADQYRYLGHYGNLVGRWDIDVIPLTGWKENPVYDQHFRDQLNAVVGRWYVEPRSMVDKPSPQTREALERTINFLLDIIEEKNDLISSLRSRYQPAANTND